MHSLPCPRSLQERPAVCLMERWYSDWLGALNLFPSLRLSTSGAGVEPVLGVSRYHRLHFVVPTHSLCVRGFVRGGYSDTETEARHGELWGRAPGSSQQGVCSHTSRPVLLLLWRERCRLRRLDQSAPGSEKTKPTARLCSRWRLKIQAIPPALEPFCDLVPLFITLSCAPKMTPPLWRRAQAVLLTDLPWPDER